MTVSYLNSVPLSERISESNRILSKFPNSIPVIIESKDEELLKKLKKNKYLVPSNVSASYLLSAVRKHLQLDSSKSIFMYCGSNIICGSEMIDSLYEDYKNKKKLHDTNSEKFFYVYISCENTFGC
jgi:hypothetical protein